ncbi:MAG: hypothetical protein ACP5K1_00615 [Candidatus Bathyarchaeia archaeon]
MAASPGISPAGTLCLSRPVMLVQSMVQSFIPRIPRLDPGFFRRPEA